MDINAALIAVMVVTGLALLGPIMLRMYRSWRISRFSKGVVGQIFKEPSTDFENKLKTWGLDYRVVMGGIYPSAIELVVGKENLYTILLWFYGAVPYKEPSPDYKPKMTIEEALATMAKEQQRQDEENEVRQKEALDKSAAETLHKPSFNFFATSPTEESPGMVNCNIQQGYEFYDLTLYTKGEREGPRMGFLRQVQPLGNFVQVNLRLTPDQESVKGAWVGSGRSSKDRYNGQESPLSKEGKQLWLKKLPEVKLLADGNQQALDYLQKAYKLLDSVKVG